MACIGVRALGRAVRARVHKERLPALFDFGNNHCLPKSMKRNRYHDLEGRVRKVLRFERFFAARLREATKAAFVNDVNAAQLGILRLLRDRPAPPGWLSWQ